MNRTSSNLVEDHTYWLVVWNGPFHIFESDDKAGATDD